MQSRFVSSSCQAIVLVTAFAWSGVTLGAPQVPPSAPVTVVNTSNNPVPVTGSVGVTGTVNGAVMVTNPDSASVPIHDAGQPQPVDGQCTVVGGGQRTSFCDIFTVPAGKRLVVELISYSLNGSPTDGDPVRILFGDSEILNCGNCASRYFLPPVFAGTNGALYVFADMRQTRVYLDQNKTLGGRVDWDENNSLGGSVTFSGFLVNR